MKRLAIVLNPGSGKSETSKGEIAKLFNTKKFELKFFAITKGVGALQKDIKVYTPQAIVAVGGDGTVNAVATIASQLQLPMGVLPAGTLNHFAKDMNIPTDLAEAATVIAKLHTVSVDYGTINDRVFVNNCNLGGYPETVLKRDKLTGSIPSKFIAGIIAALHVRSDHSRQKFEVTIDAKTNMVRAATLFIGNNRYKLAGTQFTTRRHLNKGILQLVIIKTGRVRHLLGILIGFIVKRPHEKAAVYEAKTIQIRSGREKHNVAVDGEVISLYAPLTIVSHPKKLMVIVFDGRHE